MIAVGPQIITPRLDAYRGSQAQVRRALSQTNAPGVSQFPAEISPGKVVEFGNLHSRTFLILMPGLVR